LERYNQQIERYNRQKYVDYTAQNANKAHFHFFAKFFENCRFPLLYSCKVAIIVICMIDRMLYESAILYGDLWQQLSGKVVQSQYKFTSGQNNEWNF